MSLEAARLNLVAVNAAGTSVRHGIYACACQVAAVEVLVLEVEGVDMAGEVAENGQEEVDEEIGTAACNEKDTQGWDWGDVRMA